MNLPRVALACLFLLVGAASSWGQPSSAGLHSAESPSPASGVLVDPAWLVKRLHDPQVRILELGQQQQYALGHIPRAVFVDWIGDITDAVMPQRYNVLPKAQMQRLLGRLGVSPSTTIVLYDRLECRLSTRMFWSLRYHGHRPVKILDGGEKAWRQAGQQLVREVPVFAETKYSVGQVRLAAEAERPFIQSHLGQPQFALVDGRPVEQYTGRQPGKVYHTGKEHARRGHLPQAVNIPWQENLTAEGKFKPVDQLRELYARHGLTPRHTVVTYCNEGLHAAHPWFVLTELLGYRDVRLYDDSLAEWANMPGQPLVLGSPP